MAEIDWARVQSYFGFSGAEMQKIRSTPKLMKVMRAAPRIVRARLVCEVVSSRGCAVGLKPGQRYVMTCVGQVLPEQCTAPLCSEMIAPLIWVRRIVHDRLCEGSDPNGMVWDYVKCNDLGLQDGGLGQVVMKVWVEEPAARK